VAGLRDGDNNAFGKKYKEAQDAFDLDNRRNLREKTKEIIIEAAKPERFGSFIRVAERLGIPISTLNSWKSDKVETLISSKHVAGLLNLVEASDGLIREFVETYNLAKDGTVNGEITSEGLKKEMDSLKQQPEKGRGR